MNALELVQLITTVLFVALFALVAITLIRQRSRVALDIALFFGSLALAVTVSRVLPALGAGPATVQVIAIVLVMSLPYLMLRLLADFTPVPWLVMRGTEAGLILAIFLLTVSAQPLPLELSLGVVAYFAAVSLYAGVGFARLAIGSSGVTRRRTQAVAAGIILLGVAVLVAGVAAFIPSSRVTSLTSALTQLIALGAAGAWLVGFTPPRQLRRYWQEPELRAFIGRAAELTRLRDTDALREELERGIGASFGAVAVIGLADRDASVLRFRPPRGALPDVMPIDSGFLAARVFRDQQPSFFPDATAAHPEHAAAYRVAGIGPVLIAPLTAGERRFGVLEVFAARRPIFSEDDLALAQLLAEQAAVILENQTLVEEAAAVQAQEQAAQLKEDFVSAAAHDLKTPLTTLLAQAQILEMRFTRDGSLARHVPAVARISREARRLSLLVEDLLDASRIDEGKLEVRRERGDLAILLKEVTERPRAEGQRVRLEVSGPLVGQFDRRRLAQLVDNLIENGLKYSPPNTPVEVHGWRENGAVRISVRDRGIGIPASDIPHVFDRFRRATNVDARRYAGIGLGLYICRGIAEQHGGRIWVESAVGSGSTFHVTLPDAERKLN